MIAASGAGKKEFYEKPITPGLEALIEGRKSLLAANDSNDFVKITLDDKGEFVSEAISTIISEGDAIGSVILYNKEEKSKMGDTESQLVSVAAGFLGKQMEQ